MVHSIRLTIIAALALGLSLEAAGQEWRATLARAQYNADASEPAARQDGSPTMKEKSLETLEAELAEMLHFEGDEAPAAALEAGRTLANYRRSYAERRGDRLPSRASLAVEFFILDPDGPHGAPARRLGTSRGLIRPGAPLRDGAVLNFSRTKIWFIDDDGAVQEASTGLPAESAIPARGAYLAADARKESSVLNGLAEMLDYSFIYVGDPQPVRFEREAADLDALFTGLTAGLHKVHQDGDRINAFDSPEAEDALRRSPDFSGASAESLDMAQIRDVVEQHLGRLDETLGGMDGSASSLLGPTLEWAAQRLADHPQEARDFSRRMTRESLRAIPSADVSDSELDRLLHRALWFDKDHNHPQMWDNVLEGFRREAESSGRHGDRAARFADILEQRRP